jgi:hypothetical protein
MHNHQEAQEGRVELNIGGHRFETSVQALRRVPHTFFDAYVSGRYAQDVCNDGSIFVDRDGEHFGHVLEYMRDGHVSVAEPGARPSVALLRALKREFGFYSSELYIEQAEQGTYSEQAELVFVMGGTDFDDDVLSSMERYDVTSGQWVKAAPMSTARSSFGACAVAGELYVTGGSDGDGDYRCGPFTCCVRWSRGGCRWIGNVRPWWPRSRVRFGKCARRGPGVRSRPCPRQDMRMLPAYWEVTSMCSEALAT